MHRSSIPMPWAERACVRACVALVASSFGADAHARAACVGRDARHASARRHATGPAVRRRLHGQRGGESWRPLHGGGHSAFMRLLSPSCPSARVCVRVQPCTPLVTRLRRPQAWAFGSCAARLAPCAAAAVGRARFSRRDWDCVCSTDARPHAPPWGDQTAAAERPPPQPLRSSGSLRKN